MVSVIIVMIGGGFFEAVMQLSNGAATFYVTGGDHKHYLLKGGQHTWKVVEEIYSTHLV